MGPTSVFNTKIIIQDSIPRVTSAKAIGAAMSQSSGRLAGRMKWLVARYPKESGKLITLGSILTDPEEPETRLNRDEVVPINPDDIMDESLAVSRKVAAELSEESNVLLKAVPPEIFGPGVSVDGKLTAGVTTIVEAMNVQAQVFLPRRPEEYMNASLDHVEVQNWVRKHFFVKCPLYLIVGVATANKLSIKESQSRDMAISGKARIGTNLAGGAGHTREVRFRISSPRIQILEVQKRGNGQRGPVV